MVIAATNLEFIDAPQELAMAVALLSDRPGALLICNGYKDAAYMELVRMITICLVVRRE